MTNPDRRALSSRPLLDTDVDARLFVDRESEMNLLERTLRDGFNAVLVGDRGSGKTSCLRQLALRLRRDMPEGRIVFVDGTLPGNAVELLEFVRARIGGTRYRSRSALPDFLLPQPVQGEPEKLMRALDRLREVVGDDEYVVLVDGTPNPREGHVIFGRLRDELWSIGITWAIAVDSDQRGTVLKPPADTFFERMVILPPLSDSAARELIERRTRGELEPDELMKVVSTSEGNPRRLVSAARERATEEASDERTARRQALLAVLGERGRAATMLVAELEARGSASASDEGLQKRLGWSRARLAQVFQELEKSGIVTSSSRSEGGPGRPKKVYELVDRILSA